MTLCPHCHNTNADQTVQRGIQTCPDCGAEFREDHVFTEGSYRTFMENVLNKMAAELPPHSASAVVNIRDNVLDDKDDIQSIFEALMDLTVNVNSGMPGRDTESETTAIVEGIEKISDYAKVLASRKEITERTAYRMSLMEGADPWAYPGTDVGEIPTLDGEMDDQQPSASDIVSANEPSPEMAGAGGSMADRFAPGEAIPAEGGNEPPIFEMDWMGEKVKVSCAEGKYNVIGENGPMISYNEETGDHEGIEKFSEEQLAELDAAISELGGAGQASSFTSAAQQLQGQKATFHFPDGSGVSLDRIMSATADEGQKAELSSIIAEDPSVAEDGVYIMVNGKKVWRGQFKDALEGLGVSAAPVNADAVAPPEDSIDPDMTEEDPTVGMTTGAPEEAGVQGTVQSTEETDPAAEAAALSQPMLADEGAPVEDPAMGLEDPAAPAAPAADTSAFKSLPIFQQVTSNLKSKQKRGTFDENEALSAFRRVVKQAKTVTDPAQVDAAAQSLLDEFTAGGEGAPPVDECDVNGPIGSPAAQAAPSVDGGIGQPQDESAMGDLDIMAQEFAEQLVKMGFDQNTPDEQIAQYLQKNEPEYAAQADMLVPQIKSHMANVVSDQMASPDDQWQESDIDAAVDEAFGAEAMGADASVLPQDGAEGSEGIVQPEGEVGEGGEEEFLAKPIEDEEHEEAEADAIEAVGTKAEKAQAKIEAAKDAIENLEAAVGELTNLEGEEGEGEEAPAGEGEALVSAGLDEPKAGAEECDGEECEAGDDDGDADDLGEVEPSDEDGEEEKEEGGEEKIEEISNFKRREIGYELRNEPTGPVGGYSKPQQSKRQAILAKLIAKGLDAARANAWLDSKGIMETAEKLEELDKKKVGKHDFIAAPKRVPTTKEATGKAPDGHVVKYVTSKHDPTKPANEQWSEEEAEIPLTQAEASKGQVDKNGKKIPGAEKEKKSDEYKKDDFKAGRPGVKQNKEKVEEMTRFNGYRLGDKVKVPGYAKSFELVKISGTPVKFTLTEGKVSITLDANNDQYELDGDMSFRQQRQSYILEDTRAVWESMEKELLNEGCAGGSCSIGGPMTALNSTSGIGNVTSAKPMFVRTPLRNLSQDISPNDVYAYIKNNSLHMSPREAAIGHVMSNFQNPNVDVSKIFDDAVLSLKHGQTEQMNEVDSSYGYKTTSTRGIDVDRCINEGYEELRKQGLV